MQTDSFTKYHGRGDLPVAVDAVVTILRRDGSTQTGPAGHWHHARDCFNSWRHNGGNCDIVGFSAA